MVYRANDNLRDGLVLHLPFSEGIGTSVKDTSPYANNGIFGAGGDAPTWVEGIEGRRALSFVNDHIRIPKSDSLDITGQLTIFAKMKRTGAGSLHPRIVTHDYSDGYCFLMKITTMYPWFTLEDDGATHYDLIGDEAVPLNEVHDWAAVYDGTYMRIYQNAVERWNNNIGSITINVSPLDMFIGRKVDTNDNFLDSIMYKLLIYNRALNPIELRSLSNLRGII